MKGGVVAENPAPATDPQEEPAASAWSAETAIAMARSWKANLRVDAEGVIHYTNNLPHSLKEDLRDLGRFTAIRDHLAEQQRQQAEAAARAAFETRLNDLRATLAWGSSGGYPHREAAELAQMEHRIELEIARRTAKVRAEQKRRGVPVTAKKAPAR